LFRFAVFPHETKDGHYAFFGGGEDIDLSDYATDREGFIKLFFDITGIDNSAIEFGNMRWVGRWKPNVRMVNEFRDGRVFLAGGNVQDNLF
jgi:hypothetical protein